MPEEVLRGVRVGYFYLNVLNLYKPMRNIFITIFRLINNKTNNLLLRLSNYKTTAKIRYATAVREADMPLFLNMSEFLVPVWNLGLILRTGNAQKYQNNILVLLCSSLKAW